MKFFISSVIGGYEEYRDTIQDVIESLGHEAIRAEKFGASSASPRVACLSGVREADAIVLLIGRRYGDVQASGLSATHEEFHEAQNRKEILAFVEAVDTREPEQEKFLREVQDWCGGYFTASFSDTTTLRRIATKAIHARLLEDARGVPDSDELLERCRSLMPKSERGYSGGGPVLAMAIASGPRQTLLRPQVLESDNFENSVFQVALMGGHAVFDRREGTDKDPEGNALVLRQETRHLEVHPDGSLVASMPASEGRGSQFIVEETFRKTVERLVGLFNDILTMIDEAERISHVCPAVRIIRGNYLGWKTLEVLQANPNSGTIHTGDHDLVVFLDPPIRPRAWIRSKRAEIAEDLTVLMRRQFR